MSPYRITILRDISRNQSQHSDNELVVTFDELRQWVVNGSVVKHLFRYGEVRLLTYKHDVLLKPLLTALVLKALSRGECFVEDKSSLRQIITCGHIVRLFLRLVIDFFGKQKIIGLVKGELNDIERNLKRAAFPERVILSEHPVYLRSDLWFGVASGGSVGHIAGVLNNLDQFTGKPFFLTSDSIPTVRGDIEIHTISPANRFWDFPELPSLFYNDTFYDESYKKLNGRKLSFIYQRYSLNNYTGLKLAQQYGIPFVLEYNGSEIWVNRNWGKRLKYEALSERIEMLNLRAATLIVVVSAPLKDELTGRGIDPKKILVNPNGVNPDRYSPEVDGSAVRTRFGLEGRTVIGFIGTFGKWHGAEVLAEAFGRLLKQHPTLRATVRLLMIGDGMTMPLVKETLAEYSVGDACILAGRLPQEDGPPHLAACDILASPHVPNPDGTPFFGSPTKLFEYMAMGRGIVASNLDQIGEILEHNKTAWMVKPGDAESLMHGLKKLIDDKALRDRLGKAAREEVVAKYTWKEHTRKIVDRLQDLLKERN